VPIHKKQIQRLIRLVGQLKENRYPNCSSFVEDMRRADLDENLNLACTEKTIYRDIKTLKNDFEAPVVFSKSRNGYFLSDHNWEFTCPQIYDDSEMLAAVLGARVAEHIFPEAMKLQIRNAVDFMLTCNNPGFLDRTRIDSLVVIPGNRAKIDAKIFMPLFHAWQNHEICHITYHGSKGETSERDFEPHALVFYDGTWYTKGFCHARKEMRTLVLPRIAAIAPTGRCFEPDPEIIKTADEDGIFDQEIIRDVNIICDEYLACIVQTRPLHLNQEITPLPDGGCRLHVAAMSKYRLITWTMRQCGRAVVSSPQEIALEIVKLCNDLTKKQTAAAASQNEL